MKRPVELIVPAVADHLTAELKLPAPLTVAAHCEVAFRLTVDGLHATCTDVTPEDDCTLTDVLPDLLGSWVLVAVTVTGPVVTGAVKTPLELTVPLLADHTTAELSTSEPATVAVHCEVAFAAIAAGEQADVTEAISDEALLLPPQATSPIKNKDIPEACRTKCLTGPPVRWRRELPM